MVLLAALVVAAIFVIGWPLLHTAGAEDVVATPTPAADERVRLRVLFDGADGNATRLVLVLLVRGSSSANSPRYFV